MSRQPTSPNTKLLFNKRNEAHRQDDNKIKLPKPVRTSSNSPPAIKVRPLN